MNKFTLKVIIIIFGVLVMTACTPTATTPANPNPENPPSQPPYVYKHELDKRVNASTPSSIPAPLELLLAKENFGIQNYEVLSKSSDSKLLSIKFDSISYNGVPTKVFAFLGYPKTYPASGKAPAVVLVHGGGGKAFSNWVREWNDKGYVAIAIDTEGKDNTGNRVGYGGPVNDNLSAHAQPIANQWMFHAITAAIRAHSILINDPLVDASRTGICGISWGGMITSTTMCVDNRFSFAIPTYIKGYLKDNQAYFGGNYFPNEALDLWDSSNYYYLLKDNDMRVLFLNSDEDGFYSIDADSKCYDNVPNSQLTILNRLVHTEAMDWKIADRAVMIAFADQVTKGNITMPNITMQPKATMARAAELYYQKSNDIAIKSATIYALTGEYSYSSGVPKTITNRFEKLSTVVTIDNTNGVLSFDVPSNVTYYYVNIVVENAAKELITTSSKLVRLAP